MKALFLLVVGGSAWYFTTTEERQQLLRGGLSRFRELMKMADQHRLEPEPFRDALRARAAVPYVTIGLAALNVLAYVLASSSAVSGDPEGLVPWGGSFGPRTTDGEWWRLVTAIFIHAGVLPLLVNLAALAQVGVVLERLVGRIALVTVYLASGVLSGLVSLYVQPMTVSVGASAAVFSLYGLLIASTIWSLRRRSDEAAMSWAAGRRLLPIAAVFVLYHLVSGGLGTAAVRIGLVFGVIAGAVLTRDAGQRQAPPLRVGAVAASALIIAVIAAVPLRGISDVRPEMRRLVEIEAHIAQEYDRAANQFRLGAINAKALAQLIDRTIVPELREARARVKALVRVPREHQPLVARADEYLRLRDESWRLRSEALHKANMMTLRKADRAERASLDAFEKIKLVDQY